MNNQSKLNIAGVLKQTKTTDIYKALNEAIVNSIQSINLSKKSNGEINIRVIRSNQTEMYGKEFDIIGFEIFDNGTGFDLKNQESFNTLYSDYKEDLGCKGFGRFIYIKNFEDCNIESVFLDENKIFKKISFKVSKDGNTIISNPNINSNISDNKTYTKLLLKNISKKLNIDIDILIKKLIENLLGYFKNKETICPLIQLFDGEECIVLNDKANDIPEIELDVNSFNLKNENFSIRLFKISDTEEKNSINLLANNCSVKLDYISRYIKEFKEPFVDDEGKKFYIKACVFSDYLDKNVSLEREEFSFDEKDIEDKETYQKEISTNTASIILSQFKEEIENRKKVKQAKIEEYVQQRAPWHKSLLKDIDFSKIEQNFTDRELDKILSQERFDIEQKTKEEVSKALNSNLEISEDSINNLVGKIKDFNKDDLVRYVCLRKEVTKLFEKSLDIAEDNKHKSEGYVHNIIFPKNKDDTELNYNEHNLWLIDERLNFSYYLASDKYSDLDSTQRPDILIYDNPVSFRENDEASNPVTIFEFKRPGREKLTNEDNPVDQIVRYCRKIKSKNYKNPKGKIVRIDDNTLMYGYVICTISEEYKNFLIEERQFKPMPHNMGLYNWYDALQLQIEVLDWDLVLRDAKMRNKIFFHKLGIDTE